MDNKHKWWYTSHKTNHYQRYYCEIINARTSFFFFFLQDRNSTLPKTYLKHQLASLMELKIHSICLEPGLPCVNESQRGRKKFAKNRHLINYAVTNPFINSNDFVFNFGFFVFPSNRLRNFFFFKLFNSIIKNEKVQLSWSY